jgi:hypothetical protein
LWNLCPTIGNILLADVNFITMVSEILMWEAKCDLCNKQFELYDGFMALNEKSAIVDYLVNDDSWNLLEDGRCFCSDCHETHWDEDGENLLAFTKATQNSGAKLLGVVI